MSDDEFDLRLRAAIRPLVIEVVPKSVVQEVEAGGSHRPAFRVRMLAAIAVVVAVLFASGYALSGAPRLNGQHPFPSSGSAQSRSPTPFASSTPTELASPATFVPLASILIGPLPKQSEAEAAASISAMLAAYPNIATAFLNGSTNLPLAEVVPDPSCFSIQDVRTYEANAPRCLVSFQALRQAYRMSDDPGFMAAAKDLLGAMQRSMPTALFPRFERDLLGLSDFLESQTRL
jgi:hypothetical protein